MDATKNLSYSLKEWIQSYILLFHSEDGWDSQRIANFISILWSIWTTRNGRVFKNMGGHVRLVMDRMRRGMKDMIAFPGRKTIC